MKLSMEINPADLIALRKSLDKLGRPDLLQAILGQIGKNIQAKAKFYPPAIPRRTIGAWYERGYGWQYNGVRGRETSEDLGKQWRTQAFPTSVDISNEATYAGWVHGEDQVPFHARRGWKKLLVTAIEELPAIIQAAQAQIKKIWEGKA